MSLMLHTGAFHAKAEEVFAIPTPPATETWHPLAHQVVIERVRETLAANNLTIIDEALALAREGQRMFGYMEVTNGHGNKDYGLVVGVRNSHDKSFPVSLAVGHRVFVCDNLAFSGEVVISHKHTSRVGERLPEMMSRAVGLLIAKRHTMERRIEQYKASEIGDFQAHDLIVRALLQNVCASNQVAAIAGQWHNPEFPDFADRNVWSLMNAFTGVMKRRPVLDMDRRTLRLHGLCDMLAGVQLDDAEKAASEAGDRPIVEVME